MSVVIWFGDGFKAICGQFGKAAVKSRHILAIDRHVIDSTFCVFRRGIFKARRLNTPVSLWVKRAA
jgi:hypothetical protein